MWSLYGQDRYIDKGKMEFDDLPWLGLCEIVKVSNYGAQKYDKKNYQKGGPASQYFNCNLRHLLKWWLRYDENDIDTESGCHHLGHSAWNSIAPIELEDLGTLEDDRPKYSKEKVKQIFDFLDGVLGTEINKKYQLMEDKDETKE